MRILQGMCLLLTLTGCVFSPQGEDEERQRANDSRPGEDPGPLPAAPSLEEVLNHAYLANAGLKERWWAWQAALEQIPQDASQPTTLAVTYAQMFENGNTSWAQTTFGVTNDPMANFMWPGKLKTAGRRALELAKAEGHRFEAARLEIRSRVVSAWLDFWLAVESLRILERDVAYLEANVESTDARVRAGGAPQQDLIKARTERDLSRNRLETLRTKRTGRLATLNAILNRNPLADLPLPEHLPTSRKLMETDQEILSKLSVRNPELQALSRMAASREETVSMMRQQYLPDFGLGVSGDAGGIVRSLMGMLTAPVFRYPAIQASISQARAELEMTRSLRVQMEHDLKAKAVMLIYDFRNADRQVGLYESRILPLAEQAAEASRSAYTTGRVPAIEMIDAQRMRLEAGLMLIELKVEREKSLAELEALAGGPTN